MSKSYKERLKSNRPKNATVWLTSAEHDSYKDMSDLLGISKSSFLRALLGEFFESGDTGVRRLKRYIKKNPEVILTRRTVK